MVQFIYDEIMKRYDVRLPFTLGKEESMATVASISEDNKITLHRELTIESLRQIFMHWDEYSYQKGRVFDVAEGGK